MLPLLYLMVFLVCQSSCMPHKKKTGKSTEDIIRQLEGGKNANELLKSAHDEKMRKLINEVEDKLALGCTFKEVNENLQKHGKGVTVEEKTGGYEIINDRGERYGVQRGSWSDEESPMASEAESAKWDTLEKFERRELKFKLKADEEPKASGAESLKLGTSKKSERSASRPDKGLKRALSSKLTLQDSERCNKHRYNLRSDEERKASGVGSSESETSKISNRSGSGESEEESETIEQFEARSLRRIKGLLAGRDPATLKYEADGETVTLSTDDYPPDDPLHKAIVETTDRLMRFSGTDRVIESAINAIAANENVADVSDRLPQGYKITGDRETGYTIWNPEGLNRTIQKVVYTARKMTP